MSALDNINKKFGKNSVFLLGQGMDNKWFPRSNNASPCYTSKWADLLMVKAYAFIKFYKLIKNIRFYNSFNFFEECFSFIAWSFSLSA